MPEPIRERRFVVAGQPITVEPIAPGLHIVATPIGNLADISLRALATLAAADLLYCEDTRVTRKLLDRYGINQTLRPYHEHNARGMRPLILDQLRAGARLALVSDAGTPLISDPGYRLVRAAISEGLAVHAVPGPSALVMALALSGLPTDRFTFAGFLPAKAHARRSALAQLRGHGTTLVLFETAPRILAALADIAEALGDPPVAIARELTKLHEEVLRGRASEVAEAIQARGGIKGEITVVVGPPVAAAVADADIDEALADALGDMTPAKAASAVAKRFDRPKSDIYRRALAIRGARGDADLPTAVPSPRKGEGRGGG